MKCPNCNIANPDDVRFCSACGAQLSRSASASNNVTNDESTRVHEQTKLNRPTRVEQNSDPLVGCAIAGKYRLNAKLGAGGMGSVYRAMRVMIGDEVAVKILHSDQNDPRAAERFQREAQAAARLKHPNAVAIHDFGITDDGLRYLVMELVEGESLRHIIKREGPLTPSASAQIITQVCAALDEAHNHKIIHRDIKPDNIVVNITTNGLRVKVLDFGIAKLHDDSAGNLTQSGSILGTPHYMSPEQCLGEELDARSDVYSLGVVAYEMLTGTVPFNSPSSAAVVVQHVNQSPTPPRLLNAGLSGTVEAPVLRALQKSREARPPSAGVFAREFKDGVDGVHLVTPAPGVNLSQKETISPATMVMHSQSWGPAFATSQNVSRDTMGAQKGTNTAVTVGITSLATILLLALGGLAVSMFRGSGEPTSVTSNHQMQENPSSQAPATTNVQPPAPVVSRPTPLPINVEALRQEVVEALNGWAGAARAHDLDAQMSYYAELVDPYFRKRNVSAAEVRANRSQAYSRYHRLDIQLSNFDISIDTSGSFVTATFDKIYAFEGDKYLNGSVRSMLWLTKTGSRWLITGEKDLKVYYISK